MRNRKIPFSGGLVNIAGVTSRLSDEESGHFPQQIPVKPACRYRQVGRFKRFGYIWTVLVKSDIGSGDGHRVKLIQKSEQPKRYTILISIQ